MKIWSRYAIAVGFLVICGIQFHLGYQQSQQNARTMSDLADMARRVGGFKDTIDSLSDQLNTFGRDAFDPQRQTRNLLRQMNQIGRPFIVVLGDSITQRAPFPETICGYPVINAGISGSRTSSFIPFAEEMARLDPALIVLALGVNDSSRRLKTAFQASYAALVDSLPKVPTMLASIAPVDFSGIEGQTIDPEAVDLVNREIRLMAETRKLPLVELASYGLMRSSKASNPHFLAASDPERPAVLVLLEGT